MTTHQDRIRELEKEEKSARSKSHFQEIEQAWEDLILSANNNELRILVSYNRFRLRNLIVLKKKRPALILGYVNDHNFPNFHTYELLKVADIVSLTTTEENADSIDRVFYFPASDDYRAIRKKLPKGFQPDLFWDIQAAHGHMHPIGLSQMPFPTVAGICHHHHGPAVKTICEMFDYVLPVGKLFSSSCSYQGAKVLDLPFGINWASFHKSLSCTDAWDAREIDVSVSFSNTANCAYHGLRDKVIKIMENLASKWAGKYVFKIAGNLSKSDYEAMLGNSKISVNVVAINGPYNYRSCEIINSGALLFQTNVEDEELGFSYDEVLENGKDFIAFDLLDLEEKLLHFLNNPKQANAIASNAQHRIKTHFSYDQLFNNLLKLIAHHQRRSTENAINLIQDKFLLGKFLWQQHQKLDVQLLGSAFLENTLIEEKDTIRFFSNTLAILPELLQALGFNAVKDLVAKQSASLAESLDPENLKQIAVQLLSVKMDHVALWYNFLSLSIDFQWSPNEVLQQIADQALKNNSWEGYNSEWLLRPASRMPGVDQGKFLETRYNYFILPLIRAKNYQEEWDAYRGYSVGLLNH